MQGQQRPGGSGFLNGLGQGLGCGLGAGCLAPVAGCGFLFFCAMAMVSSMLKSCQSPAPYPQIEGIKTPAASGPVAPQWEPMLQPPATVEPPPGAGTPRPQTNPFAPNPELQRVLSGEPPPNPEANRPLTRQEKRQLEAEARRVRQWEAEQAAADRIAEERMRKEAAEFEKAIAPVPVPQDSPPERTEPATQPVP